MLNLQFLLNNTRYTREQLTTLTELDLWFKQIESIDERVFENCTKLKYLYLSDNKLTRIQVNTFRQLTQLQVLQLHNNELESIDERLFENCTKLEWLCLQNNKIKQIHRNTFKQLKSIKVISLYNNQIKYLSFYDGKSDVWWCLDEIKENGYFSNFEEFLDQFGKIKYFLLFFLLFQKIIYFFFNLRSLQ